MTENLSSIHDPELRQALSRLFARQTFGIKLGLEPTRLLLEAFGNPHQGLHVVHVAGTNGKGSVCAMIASTLAAAGLRVGLYSSPHLVNFRERMKVNGVMISEERLAVYAREMMPEIERIGCTFFEGTTVMGLRYFAEQKVDVVVLETGMGGRLDSTNVVMPMITAITSIGLDHTKHLGESLEEIAGEKGGIMKPGVPAVIGRVLPRLRSLFTEQAEGIGAHPLFVDDRCRALYHEMSFRGTVGSFVLESWELDRLEIDLVGTHQIGNARVALTVLETLAERYALDEEILRRGFADIRKNTGISGRFDLVQSDPNIILDVAHNADGAEVLADTLRGVLGRGERVRVVFGAVRDKDVEGALKTIAPLAGTLYAVSADNPRSLPSNEIAWWGAKVGIPTVDAGSVESGIVRAMKDSQKEETILIFGSFFVVGEAVTTLEKIGEGEGKEKEGGKQASEKKEANANNSKSTIIRQLYQAGEKEEITYSTINPITTMETITPQGRTDGATNGNNGENRSASRTAQKSEKAKPNTVIAERRSVKYWDRNEQPRERLMEHGAEKLSTAELIAILLRTGTRDKDVIQLSRDLLHAFGEGEDGKVLVNIATRHFTELQGIGGIGPTKAVTLAAAFEIGNRVAAGSFAERPVIRNPKDVSHIFIPRMRALRKEQFHVIILNTAGQIIRTELVSEGTLNSSVVHPREVYRTAIIESAASIIGLHNHPSGNPQPSKEDIAITKQLIEAGRILGIPCLDHIIIAGEESVSLVEEGLI